MVIVRNKIIRLKRFKLIVQMLIFIREYKIIGFNDSNLRFYSYYLFLEIFT